MPKSLRWLLWGVLALNLGGCALGSARTPLTPVSVRFTVAADQGWQNTGASIRAGQTFEIRYLAGQWTQFAAEASRFGPEGSAYTCSAASCCEPLPGTASGALIGKVGNETFAISLGGPFVVQTSGNLFVRMNDCDTGLRDNEGAIHLEIIH